MEKLKRMVEVRRYILGELLTTEQNYVRNLQAVLDRFRGPLIRAVDMDKCSQSTPPTVVTTKKRLGPSSSSSATVTKHTIIPMVDIKIIFAHIEDLLEFNGGFFVKLEEVVRRWEQSEETWERMQEKELEECDLLADEPKPLSIGKLFLDHVSELVAWWFFCLT